MATTTTHSRACARTSSSLVRLPAGRPSSVRCAASLSAPQQAAVAGCAAALSALLCTPLGAEAASTYRLPPIDSDPQRCARGYVGNTIGQANAVSDKVLDLRACSYKGGNLSTKVLAGALLVDADLSGADLKEAVLTKAFAMNANFTNADLTNAVVDRVDFSNANLQGAKLVNAVVTGALFEGANLADTVWEDSLIGNEDVKRLCLNPTLTGESRMQVGCRVGK